MTSRRVEKYTWYNMLRRCYNSNDPSYERYGGRGITVCGEWLMSFDNFYRDMGPRPTNQHSLDRIDNNGNYEPTNCRWATVTQQQQNKRKRECKAPVELTRVQITKDTYEKLRTLARSLGYTWNNEGSVKKMLTAIAQGISIE